MIEAWVFSFPPASVFGYQSRAVVVPSAGRS